MGNRTCLGSLCLPAGPGWHNAPVLRGLLAIFIATIVGTILRPVPSGAMVLLGITAVILTRVMPVDPLRIGTGSIETARIKQALAGYADPVVWLVLAAFFISRGMIKTGLGRRIAYLFIRTIGHKTLGWATLWWVQT